MKKKPKRIGFRPRIRIKGDGKLYIWGPSIVTMGWLGADRKEHFVRWEEHPPKAKRP